MKSRIVHCASALILALTGAANASGQADSYSASQVVPACRNLTSDDFLEQGVCLGFTP